MVFPYENGIIAIENRERLSQGDDEEFNLDQYIMEMDMQVGVSMWFSSFLDLKTALIQSKIALEQGRRNIPRQQRYDFLAFFSDHLIHSLDQSTNLKSFCHPALLQLVIKGGESEKELVRSLRLYLLNGRNISRTADKLNIHRNTLMYRLQRLEDLLGLNLKEIDEQEFLNLYLTCLTGDYRESSQMDTPR